MQKVFKVAVATLLFTASCSVLNNDKPEINASTYLTPSELDKINSITFEVQKVLDIIDDFRSSKALPYVRKLNVPGWFVYHKKEKVAFFTIKKFVAEKFFELPQSCIKNIGGAEVNVCHMKLVQSLEKLGKAYDCNVKAEEIHSEKFGEKVKISCSY